jgi:hypothetical protein
MSIHTIIGILGLPRSGTTMFGAVFDAHPDVVTLYEPWNSDAEDVAAQVKSIQEENTLDFLFNLALGINPTARVLVIKETATQPEYVTKLLALMDDAGSVLSSQLILLLRNPIHCFLSEVDARRRWWGDPSTDVTVAFFLEWASSRLPALGEMATSIRLRGGGVVFYDTLVTQPDISFNIVMREFGIPFCSGQLLINQNTDLSRIRGDMSLTETPRNVESASVNKRRLEVNFYGELFLDLAWYKAILDIVEHLTMHEGLVVLTPSSPEYEIFLLTLEEKVALAQKAADQELSRMAWSDDRFKGDH